METADNPETTHFGDQFPEKLSANSWHYAIFDLTRWFNNRSVFIGKFIAVIKDDTLIRPIGPERV